MSGGNKRIPKPVVGRLTRYLFLVQQLREEGYEWVSSPQIAEALGLTSSTVRQDLSHLEVSGTSKCGYETKRLEWVLYKELGADRVTNVVIVGAGNLGRALALHGGFDRQGFAIRAIFDNDGRIIGKRVGDFTVQDIKELPAVVSQQRIDVGVVAVPGGAAQQVASALSKAGVKGILNLTPAHVEQPGGPPVVDIRITSGLQELLYFIKVAEAGQAD